MTDILFMKRALENAQKAAQQGDVPVGAVIVYKGEVIGEGYNKREKEKNALLHAEICAIAEACKKLSSWRLRGATMYVTLEPCPMCAGAIINSRIDRVVFGAYDEKAGCLGSVDNFSEKGFNHSLQITGGLMQEECGKILGEFFSKRR